MKTTLVFAIISTVAYIPECFALTVTPDNSAIGTMIGGFLTVIVTVDPPDVDGKWYRRDLSGHKVEVQSTPMFSTTLYHLNIYPMTVADIGYYIFRANDGQTEVENTPIAVYLSGTAPSVGTTTPIVRTSTGHTEKIQCDYIPKTSNSLVRWAKTDAFGTITDIEVADTTKYSGGTNHQPTLIIMNIRESDFGTYACIVSNLFGENSVNVIVQKSAGSLTTTQSTAELVPTSADFTPFVNITTNFTKESTYSEGYSETTKFSETTEQNTTMPENTTYYNTITVDFESTTNASNLNEQISTSNSIQTTISENNASNGTMYVTPDFNGTTTQPGSVSVNNTESHMSSLTSDVTGEIATTVSRPSVVGAGSSTSAVPQSTSGVIGPTNVPIESNIEGALCPCLCAYKEKLDYWAAQNFTNYTMEELRIILRPVLLKLENELRVNKKNLSATVRKLTSAKDNRPSVKSVGGFGIILILIPVLLLVFVDVTSLKQHLNNIAQQGSLRISQIKEMQRKQK